MDRRKFITTAGVAGTAAAAATVAAPAIASSHREMTIVASWGRDFPGLGISAQRLAARINEVSEGRIKTTYYAAGEKVGAFDVFDDVASGNSQAFISAAYYWKGKHPGFAYFCAVPFGMTTIEWNAWIKFKGGQALWDELNGEYGLKSLPAGATGTQMGGWFNKEINSLEDLKGLKMRTPGFAGEVMAELGVSVTNLPPGELYTALERGTVDAVEWVGPALDFQMGFHQIAKYYYSGWQEPGAEVQFLINKKTWEELPKDLQEILRVAMRTAAYDMYIQSTHQSGVAWDRMKEDYPDVTHKVFPPEVIDALRSTTNRLLAEAAEDDPLAKEIIESQRDYLKQVRQWTNISDKAYLNSVAED